MSGTYPGAQQGAATHPSQQATQMSAEEELERQRLAQEQRGTAAERRHAADAEKKAAADVDAERKVAEAKAAKALEPVSADVLLLLLATDWLVGDKSHYDVIRRAVRKLLTDAGESGAEALLRLEGRASLDDAAQMSEDIATLQAVLDAHHIAVPVGMRRRTSTLEQPAHPPTPQPEHPPQPDHPATKAAQEQAGRQE